MEKTKKKELDMSLRKCHACGGELSRDLDRGTEKCTMPGCLIRNINFTIPFIEDPEEDKEEKQNAENETK